MYSPRLGVHLSSPVTASAIDTITVGVGASYRSVWLQTSATAAARPFTLSLAGWRGDQTAQPRSFLMENVAMQAEQTLIANIGDGGKELWLKNVGEQVVFDLTIFAGTEPQAAGTRPKATLSANAITRLRPVDWQASTMSRAAIEMTTFDMSGSLVSQLSL
jgi:hypothetical protein